MRVSIALKSNDEWLITPLEGKFSGRAVATAEQVSLAHVERHGKLLSGDLTCVWGLTFLNDRLDSHTQRGIIGRRYFDMEGMVRVPVETIDRAKKVVVQGPITYTGG